MLLNFVRSLLPALKRMAMLTPTPVDDALVAAIEMLIANPDRAPEVLANMQAKGMSAPPTPAA